MARESFLCPHQHWSSCSGGHISGLFFLPVETPPGVETPQAVLWLEGRMLGLCKGTFWGLSCARGGQVVQLFPRAAVHCKYLSPAVPWR